MNSIIENLNQWGGDFASLAWPMLWQSSLLILIVFAFDFLCRRKIRASIRYALWLAVLVKLCLPPALALPTGAAWWLFPSNAAGQTRPVTKYVVTYDTTAPNDAVQPTVPMLAPQPPKLDAAGWTLLGCGFVSAALLLWLAMRWWQISRKVSCAAASEKLAGLLDEIRGRAGLRSPLRLKLVDGQMSPAVCGLFRPVILLPRVLVEQLSAAQLRAVLLHEAFHLRRKDVWINCAQALLQIVYWWHPLLWLANARIRRLREEAVDDAVMLALSDEAENYAPTLLAVAKLAFSRPLTSLGLVGIMESRSALRKRIERLVNFSAPRKAGLTFLSLGGIFVFSAVALPMGQAPASAPDSLPTDEASGETTLTVKVDPEVFIRNVKARADWTIPTGTNDYTEILLGLLRSEGVNCNPPHGIAFNTKTGEMTMQNTPEQLEVFRRVSEQLNRTDGKAELPLRDSPIHQQSILIEARFFWMPSADFEILTRDLHAYPGAPGGAPWWSVAPDRFGELNDRIKSLNLKPFTTPRVQTGHGITGEFYVGTNTNGTEFDCRPLVIPGGIELAFRTQITGVPTGQDQTLVGTNRFQIHGMAAAEDYGGIVLRAENPNGSTANLVLVLGLHLVTNGVAPHFEQRLVPLTRQVSGDTASQAGTLVQDAKVLYEMGKLDDAETKLKAALALNPDNTAAQYYLAQVQAAKAGQGTGMLPTQPGRKKIVDMLNRIRLENVSYDDLPLSEVIRSLSEQTKLRDPEKKGIKFLINPNPDTPGGINPTTGLPEATTPAAAAAAPLDQVVITLNLTNVKLADLLDAIVKVADHPIKYSIADYGVEFSAKGYQSTTLFFRTFKIDPRTSLAGLRRQTQFTGTDAQDVVKALKKIISEAGVDLQPTNKAVFYDDRRGLIIVRATTKDLDAVEHALQAFNATATAPQIHIKARFWKVPREFWTSLGKTLALTTTADGKTVSVLNSRDAAVALNSLPPSHGFENLAEPEVVTTCGRQTQMRTTQIISIITNFTSWETATNFAIAPQWGPLEIGPILDIVPSVLPDGYTIDLKTTALLTTFFGYADTTNLSPPLATNSSGEVIALPVVLPAVQIKQESAQVRLYDGQTLLLSGFQPEQILFSKPDEERDRRVADHIQQAEAKSGSKTLIVLVTATLVDPAGNRVHSDDEMPFARTGVSPQPY